MGWGPVPREGRGPAAAAATCTGKATCRVLLRSQLAPPPAQRPPTHTHLAHNRVLQQRRRLARGTPSIPRRRRGVRLHKAVVHHGPALGRGVLVQRAARRGLRVGGHQCGRGLHLHGGAAGCQRGLVVLGAVLRRVWRRGQGPRAAGSHKLGWTAQQGAAAVLFCCRQQQATTAQPAQSVHTRSPPAHRNTTHCSPASAPAPLRRPHPHRCPPPPHTAACTRPRRRRPRRLRLRPRMPPCQTPTGPASWPPPRRRPASRRAAAGAAPPPPRPRAPPGCRRPWASPPGCLPCWPPQAR